MQPLLPGRTGYKSQMTSTMEAEYERQMEWFRAQLQLGNLGRGWQSQCAADLRISNSRISDVVRGVKFSPPTLSLIYFWARENFGQIPEDDYSRADYYKELVDAYDARINPLETELQELGTKRDQEIAEATAVIQARWDQKEELIQRELRDLVEPRAELQEKLEFVLIELGLTEEDLRREGPPDWAAESNVTHVDASTGQEATIDWGARLGGR